MKINIDQNTIYFAGLLTLKQIDITKIETLDTAGAYFILKILKDLGLPKKDLVLDNGKDKNLIELVANTYPTKIDKEYSNKSNIFLTSIYNIGKSTNNLLLEVKTSIIFRSYFLGYLTLIRKPYKSFFSIVLNIAYDSTIKVLSIVMLLSLYIGLVLTYLPLNLMMQYGTQIFVVDMLGISSFREFAPLFTAIIIAGRNGSAFTSEIGIMKVNEEIDALQTIGEDPIQRLVLPRITALIISLPVLTIIAMIANIIVGIIIADIIAGITPLQFIQRLFSNVNVNHLYIVLLKAPFLL